MCCSGIRVDKAVDGVPCLIYTQQDNYPPLAGLFFERMSDTPIQYLSQQKLEALTTELKMLQTTKIPALAQRIDDTRQLGDLSENAEYHAAREEMAWGQSRVKELQRIIENAEIIDDSHETSSTVTIGSRITVSTNGKKKEYAIVGAQEANPLTGNISNESPLGSAFLGKKKGDTVQVEVPSGVQVFKIVAIE